MGSTFVKVRNNSSKSYIMKFRFCFLSKAPLGLLLVLW